MYRYFKEQFFTHKPRQFLLSILHAVITLASDLGRNLQGHVLRAPVEECFEHDDHFESVSITLCILSETRAEEWLKVAGML